MDLFQLRAQQAEAGDFQAHGFYRGILGLKAIEVGVQVAQASAQYLSALKGVGPAFEVGFLQGPEFGHQGLESFGLMATLLQECAILGALKSGKERCQVPARGGDFFGCYAHRDGFASSPVNPPKAGTAVNLW